MINMYSLFEVAFFILYFVVKAIRFILFLLTLQIVIYRLSGFSIYKFVMRKANKLVRGIL